MENILDPHKDPRNPRKKEIDPRNPRKNYVPRKMLTHVKNILTRVTHATYEKI